MNKRLALLGLTLLTHLSCADTIEASLENDPPQIITVNGVRPTDVFGFLVVVDQQGALTGTGPLVVRPGEDFEIELDVIDPDNDAIKVWFPWAPADMDFDPTSLTGVWHVPTDVATQIQLSIVLEDDSVERNARSYYVLLTADYTGIDTGLPTETETDPDTEDTGDTAVDTGDTAVDTGDTGLQDTGDTGLLDTGTGTGDTGLSDSGDTAFD